MNNWYVITGGPSVGKTTLLAELAKRGYATVPEAARTVIDESIATGLTTKQIRSDEQVFQDIVMRRKVAIEAAIDPKTITFFDRGLHDTIAYLQFIGHDVEDWIWKAVHKAQYKTVFILDPFANYTSDYARVESQQDSSTLHKLLHACYLDAGHSPVHVPALPLHERVDFVLRSL